MTRARFAGAALLLLTFAAPLRAQESRLHADLRKEGEDIKESCSGFNAKGLIGCTVTLATDDPFHVALGSLAPGNGTGFGLAFAEHLTPNERWRLGWNADGIVTTSGNYRAGVYFKVIHTPASRTGGIVVRRPGDPAPPSGSRPVTIQEYPVFNVYAQTISLDDLVFVHDGTPFKERQFILGANAVYPIGKAGAIRALNAALVGQINGRFMDVRSGDPALTDSRDFAQFGGGIRIKPSVFNDHLRLPYSAVFDQFTASGATFHRWTFDLKHEIPMYRTVMNAGPKDTNGPDECFVAVGSDKCPDVSYSRNLEGAITFRALAMQSTAGGDNIVPFYFQPTLGGADINGQRLLAGYNDYRFRGPSMLALQEGVEHSLWGPVGIYALLEQGQTANTLSEVGSDWAKSFAVGLTLRAGGFPVVNVSFAWTSEGHHIIGTIDNSLLGGSSRPSLY